MKKILFFSLMVAAGAASQAFVILDDEHADIGIGYEAGAWDLHVHDDTNDIEYEADEALFYLGTAARESASTAAAGFLGTATGSTIWRVREAPTTGVPYIGIATEEADGSFQTYSESDPRAAAVSGSATADWVTLRLKNFSGPGQFAIWSNTDNGPVSWIQTNDGISSSDLVLLPELTHQHFNFAFSATGFYTITFEASGIVNGQRVFSGDQEYFFGVEAVPEPATMTALALGLAALAKKRKRK